MSDRSQEWSEALSLPEWDKLPDFGLYMDQVIVLMERALAGVLPEGELTKSMVNNYVKVRLIPRPEGKKYEREHLALLLMICILKQAMSMEEISALLAMLCRDGVRKGYEAFLLEMGVLREAAIIGRIELRQEPGNAVTQALRAGVTAAVCTIVAREMIRCAKEEKI